MSVEALESTELPRAQTAFVIASVERAFSCNSLDVVIARHGDHGPCNDIVAVEIANCLIDFLSVYSRRAVT